MEQSKLFAGVGWLLLLAVTSIMWGFWGLVLTVIMLLFTAAAAAGMRVGSAINKVI